MKLMMASTMCLNPLTGEWDCVNGKEWLCGQWAGQWVEGARWWRERVEGNGADEAVCANGMGIWVPVFIVGVGQAPACYVEAGAIAA